MHTCRRGPANHPHHCSAAHSDLVESYRTSRRAQEERAEEYALGYKTETTFFYAAIERPLTFKEWLQHQERQPE